MSQFFTVVGAAMLMFCFMWGYTWLEVWRDPKDELTDFYARYTRTKVWVELLNKLWVPALIAGIFSWQLAKYSEVKDECDSEFRSSGCGRQFCC